MLTRTIYLSVYYQAVIWQSLFAIAIAIDVHTRELQHLWPDSSHPSCVPDRLLPSLPPGNNAGTAFYQTNTDAGVT